MNEIKKILIKFPSYMKIGKKQNDRDRKQVSGFWTEMALTHLFNSNSLPVRGLLYYFVFDPL